MNPLQWAAIFAVIWIAIACAAQPTPFETTGEKVEPPRGCVEMRERSVEC